MARNKVFSFMSSFGRSNESKHPPSPTTPPSEFQVEPKKLDQRPTTPQNRGPQQPSNIRQSPERGGERRSSRPQSMIQTYQPPLMELNSDTLPELQPIFTYLNSHGNKLYQEGYFLKLDDQNVQGRPNADRTWTECFAQLVGTILSLWDAAELDAAGADGEVLPKFINLTDASIKMVESLPTRANDDQPLQNVLSISTAGKNRYLLHFNSHHSLVQWTAAIRLAMFEYTTLQESYTGALIAGKGKTLNNINIITSKTIFKYEDWVRVRFGAGTPWKQCWCVISPPDEKEVQKLEKELKKKKSVYDRSKPPILKGNIKFYESKKITKKTVPIASITDAYSAYAIYPQSKPLIDASTLVKLEGTITIHSDPPSTTEAFVFVMPEVHAAVSGFEMMLRWLFPVYDTFHLYGRPQRLVADSLDPRCLMFAMPTERRYGYLENLDVTGLVTEEGSQSWSEQEWRKRLKELTQRRMTAINSGGGSRRNSRRGHRDSLTDQASIRSTPAVSWGAPPSDVPGESVPRTDSAPPRAQVGGFEQPRYPNQHYRSASDSFHMGPRRGMEGSADTPPAPPPHGTNMSMRNEYNKQGSRDRTGSDASFSATPPPMQPVNPSGPVQPVSKPPGFAHAANSAPPASKLQHSPELRRAKSRMSNGTLHQLAGAGGIAAQQGVAQYRADVEEEQRRQQRGGHPQDRGVNNAITTATGPQANQGLREGLVEPRRLSFENSQSDFRGPEESFSFAQTNIPSYYHSNDPSKTAYPSLARPLDFDGLKGPPPSALSNPAVIAATSDQHLNNAPRTSYESSRSSYESGGARKAVHRKPLPGSPTRTTDRRGVDNIPTSALVGQDGYDRPGQPYKNSGSYSGFPRQSVDNGSTTSATSRPSFEGRRAGMMRTVGGPSGEVPPPRTSSIIPTVDFGPTISYANKALPRDPGPRPYEQPVRGPDMPNRPRQESPRKERPTAPAQYSYQSDQSSRTIPWQPGMASPRNEVPGQRAMTPEEFVQQRAAEASAASYAHQRKKSSFSGRSETPPNLMQQRQVYSPQPGSRPGSRSAGAPAGQFQQRSDQGPRVPQHRQQAPQQYPVQAQYGAGGGEQQAGANPEQVAYQQQMARQQQQLYYQQQRAQRENGHYRG